MEIKEAVEEIRKGKDLTYTEKRGEAILRIVDALYDGYTLCKMDEALEKMRGKYWVSGAENILECIDILKEACK